MSNSAYYLDSDGKKRKVFAKHIPSSLLNKDFLCPGCGASTHCPAHMTLVRSRRGKSYPYSHFTLKSGYKHADDCPYAVSGKSVTAHLDKRGLGYNIDKEIDKYLIEKDEPIKREATGKDSFSSESSHHTTYNSNQHIRNTSAKPKDPRKLYDLLNDLPLEDSYSDRTVGELLMNHQNIAQYRQNGIPKGAACFVHVSKTKDRFAGISGIDNNWVFVEAYAFSDGRSSTTSLYFTIKLTDKIRNIVLNPDYKNFVIYTRWYPTSYPNVFVAEGLSSKMIFPIAEEDLDL